MRGGNKRAVAKRKAEGQIAKVGGGWKGRAWERGGVGVRKQEGGWWGQQNIKGGGLN